MGHSARGSRESLKLQGKNKNVCPTNCRMEVSSGEQRDRQTKRQTDKKTDRQKDRQTDGKQLKRAQHVLAQVGSIINCSLISIVLPHTAKSAVTEQEFFCGVES